MAWHHGLAPWLGAHALSTSFCSLCLAQAEEAILKLMIKRERKRLSRQAASRQRRQEAQAARRELAAVPPDELGVQRQEGEER